MLSLPDAVARARGVFTRLGHERVSLGDSPGRRASTALFARTYVPPFAASAMDGYAIRSEDVAAATLDAPVELTRSGESRAGGAAREAIRTGEAIRIFTGAPMPFGADAVLIQEEAEVRGGSILCRRDIGAGLHVRAHGCDLMPGDALVPAMGLIRAGEVAVLASQDIAALDVVRRPVVAIVSTGDELREVGEPDRPGSIVGTNAWMLAALVRREGGIPRVFPCVRDDPAAMEHTIGEALGCDVVLTTGGVSVGDHDHVPAVFARLGVDTVFAKVRMKPGKPVVVASRESTPVIGLPGNPASALVSFELFVAPGLRAMQGDPSPFAAAEELPLSAAYARSPGRPELARGRVRHIDGRAQLELAQTQRSSSLVSLLDIDRLALFDSDTALVAIGTPVFTLAIGAPGVLSESPLVHRADLYAPTRV